MASSQDNMTITQQKQLARLLFIAGALILIGAIYLWYSQVFTNTQRVFWDMVDANLKSYGQTQIQSQTNEARGLSQEQKLQLQLGAQNVVRGETALTQTIGPEQQITIETNSISTPAANYVRYSGIEINGQSAQQINPALAELQNVWAKESDVSTGSSPFVEAVYGSLGRIPIGHLSFDNRQQLVRFMQENKVYEIDFSTVRKEKHGQRSVYIYNAKVNVEQYVRMLLLFDRLSGLNKLGGIDPAQFAGGEPVTMQYTVDIVSRNLVETAYAGGQQKEVFRAPGAVFAVQEPSETVELSELQQNLQLALFSLQAAEQ